MAIKDGRDYLYLIWKCALNRRQYIVGQLTKNGHYEFQYCEEIEDALKAGFTPLHEATNPHDSNAICVINEGNELLGYVPRYYAGAFVKFITEGRIEECHVTNVEKADCCDECIGIQIKIAGVKR